jgi:hypothetical protein
MLNKCPTIPHTNKNHSSMTSEASTEQRRREACMTIPKAELHLHIEVLTN